MLINNGVEMFIKHVKLSGHNILNTAIASLDGAFIVLAVSLFQGSVVAIKKECS